MLQRFTTNETISNETLVVLISIHEGMTCIFVCTPSVKRNLFPTMLKYTKLHLSTVTLCDLSFDFGKLNFSVF